MDRDLMHLRDSLIPRYAEMIYYGFWYAPEREALQALIDESQKSVTGTVRLKLYKGNLITMVENPSSPFMIWMLLRWTMMKAITIQRMLVVLFA